MICDVFMSAEELVKVLMKVLVKVLAILSKKKYLWKYWQNFFNEILLSEFFLNVKFTFLNLSYDTWEVNNIESIQRDKWCICTIFATRSPV